MWHFKVFKHKRYMAFWDYLSSHRREFSEETSNVGRQNTVIKQLGGTSKECTDDSPEEAVYSIEFTGKATGTLTGV